MKIILLCLITIISVNLLCYGAIAQNNFICNVPENLSREKIQNGKYVFVLRHAHARPPEGTTRTDCTEISRPLSNDGKAQADKIKIGLRSLGFPDNFSDFNVYTSNTCRTVETAEIAFPSATIQRETVRNINDITNKTEYLSSQNSMNANLLIVTHSGFIRDIIGGYANINENPVGETPNNGITLVYEKVPESPTLIGCIWPNDWSNFEQRN